MYRSLHCLAFGLVFCFANSLSGQDSNTNQKLNETKIKTYADIVKAYESMKVNLKNNEEAKTLLFNTKREGFEGVMVVKMDSANGVIHLIQTMPLTVKEEQYETFLKIAQILNHGFLFPGIGINPKNRGTYYRLSIPAAPRGYIRQYELETYTRFSINKAAEFLPTIKEALNGDVELEDLLAHHQKRVRDLAAKKEKSSK